MRLRCIECRRPLTAATMVRLTYCAVMCTDCHREALGASEAERQSIGTHPVPYVPGPAELYRRIELVRAANGNAPRADAHGIGDATNGTMLHEPRPARVAGWRQRRGRSGAA